MVGWITDEVEVEVGVGDAGVDWTERQGPWVALSGRGRWVAALMEEMGTAAHNTVAAINEWGRRGQGVC